MVKWEPSIIDLQIWDNSKLFTVYLVQGRSKGFDSPAMAGPVLGKKEKKKV